MGLLDAAAGQPDEEDILLVIYLEAGQFKVDENGMERLLLFDLGPVVLFARAQILPGGQPQFEMDPALDIGSLGSAAQFVPTVQTRRRDVLKEINVNWRLGKSSPHVIIVITKSP